MGHAVCRYLITQKGESIKCFLYFYRQVVIDSLSPTWWSIDRDPLSLSLSWLCNINGAKRC